MKLKLNWDGLGIITSIACAIHCGVLPLLLPALPLFGVNIVHNKAFEWGMIFLAFFVGATSTGAVSTGATGAGTTTDFSADEGLEALTILCKYSIYYPFSLSCLTQIYI